MREKGRVCENLIKNTKFIDVFLTVLYNVYGAGLKMFCPCIPGIIVQKDFVLQDGPQNYKRE